MPTLEYPEAAPTDLDMPRKPKAGSLSALQLVELLNQAGWSDYRISKELEVAHTTFVRLKDGSRTPNPSADLWLSVARLAIREGLVSDELGPGET